MLARRHDGGTHSAAPHERGHHEYLRACPLFENTGTAVWHPDMTRQDFISSTGHSQRRMRRRTSAPATARLPRHKALRIRSRQNSAILMAYSCAQCLCTALALRILRGPHPRRAPLPQTSADNERWDSCSLHLHLVLQHALLKHLSPPRRQRTAGDGILQHSLHVLHKWLHDTLLTDQLQVLFAREARAPTHRNRPVVVLGQNTRLRTSRLLDSLSLVLQQWHATQNTLNSIFSTTLTKYPWNRGGGPGFSITSPSRGSTHRSRENPQQEGSQGHPRTQTIMLTESTGTVAGSVAWSAAIASLSTPVGAATDDADLFLSCACISVLRRRIVHTERVWQVFLFILFLKKCKVNVGVNLV